MLLTVEENLLKKREITLTNNHIFSEVWLCTVKFFIVYLVNFVK